jgi:hypothetical protein
VPQAPQFDESTLVFTQAAPHVVELVHTHFPALQAWPLVQGMLQPPQFC